jgi:hypothetical protein
MPNPPMHYIRHYTEEAVRRGAAPRPPPPIPDTYSMFGVTINNDDAIIQSLESQVRILPRHRVLLFSFCCKNLRKIKIKESEKSFFSSSDMGPY